MGFNSVFKGLKTKIYKPNILASLYISFSDTFEIAAFNYRILHIYFEQASINKRICLKWKKKWYKHTEV